MKETKKRQRFKTIPLFPTDDGLHLDDSILWFDSKLNGELSFLSAANLSINSKVPQVITTQETAKLMEALQKPIGALVCQYNRPFSIGKLNMELLPSGCILGGASLYVETEKGKLLYAPQLQPQKIDTVRRLQLKKAHSLVLGAFYPYPQSTFSNRKKEIDRLLTDIMQLSTQGECPVILCDPVGIAQELTKLLSDRDLPVAVHSKIYRVNRVYEEFGSKLGDYTLHSKYTKNKIMIFPRIDTNRLRNPLPAGPILEVSDTTDTALHVSALESPSKKYILSSYCDAQETKEVIKAVSPKELYLIGPYANRYAKELKNEAAVVKPLFAGGYEPLF